MTSDALKTWFDAAPEDQRAVLDDLRAMILAAAPGIVEEKKWSRPCYSTAGGLFCYLERTKKHVTIGFFKGALLKDPKHLLEGTGKEMRHVKIAAVFDKPGVSQLIRQALTLAR